MELTQELRDKHDIGDENPFYVIHTTLNEEQLRRAVFTTRRRDRYIYYLQMLILALIFVLLAWLFNNSRMLQGTLIFIMLCFGKAIASRQHTDDAIGAIHIKYGEVKSDVSLYFFEHHVLAIDHFRDDSKLYDYPYFKKLYMKDDFLYLCGENYKGFYVMYEDIPDRERFMKIINEKCSDVKLRK